MGNNSNDAKDNEWVDDLLASLEPDSKWRPDSQAAFNRLMERRAVGNGAHWGRFIWATALGAAVCLILLLLPWRFLLDSARPADAGMPTAAAAQDARPVVLQPVPPLQAPQVMPAEAPRIPSVPTAEPPRVGQRDGLGFTPEPSTKAKKRAQAETPYTLQTGLTEPRVVHKVQPKYTEEAKAARLQGTVRLLCVVSVDGTVEVREVTQSLGYGLDESATLAVQQWRFDPATKDGRPVPVFTSIDVHFALK